MQEEILQRLDALAAQLGVTVDYLWPLLVRREMMDGILSLALWVPFFVIVFAAYLWWLRHASKKNLYDGDSGDFVGPFTILIGVVVGALLIALPFVLHSGIMHVMNPEAYALQNIIGLIG